MRCPRCGNENPATNRFCGMCGTTLLSAPAAPAATVAPPIPAPQPPVAAAPPAPPREAPRPVAPPVAAPEQRPEPARRDPEPVGISGPSFLGLNQPAPSRGRDSGNLDYLLQDEEEPKSGAGKVIVILVALALVIGLGYLRWRNGSLPGLSSSPKKPAATQAADSSPPAAADTNSQPASSPASTPAAAPASSQPASAPPASSPDTASAPPATTSAATSVPAASTKPEAETPKTDASDKADSSDSEDSGDDEPAKPVAAAKPKPVAKPTPARPADRIAEAEKYIYGKGGVQQDCDRGLKILRPAAEQSNPKAMVSLGALYSAGLCTPRDLPTAYRWFALALRKQPENEAVQNDLKKLWSEMTQPERNLAIKLSQ